MTNGKSASLTFLVVMIALFTMPVFGVCYAPFSLVDYNSRIDVNPDSTQGMCSWYVDNINQLASQWWYYRLDDAPEQAINALGPCTADLLAPNMLQLTFTGSTLDFAVTYTLVGGDPNTHTSTIAESVRMRNKTGSPVAFHLFEYTDLDLNNTPADDTCVLTNSSSISQWDGAFVATESASVGGITPIPDAWEIAPSFQLLQKLNDASVDNLADGVTQLGPANTAFAFQWNFDIAAYETKLLSKSKIMLPSGSIGDYVWYDINADGVQDSIEPGLAGVKVIIRGDLDYDGTIDYTSSQFTDANGGYLFANLPAGNYIVTVDASTLPAGMTQTYDLDGIGTANTASLTLASGEVNLDVDFGYTGKGSLSGKLFRDCDADGLFDQGEAPLADVTVVLKDSGGNVIDTTQTDSNGAYSFDNLPAGTFTVAVEPPPAGYLQTFDYDGVLDNKTTVTLGPAESQPGLDFGYTGNLPSVAIEKTGPLTAHVGDTITYHFKVTNTGNTCLYGGMSVCDPMLGGTIWHKTPVLPGQTFEFDKTYTIKCSDPKVIVNTATATGCPPLGGKVTAKATWTVRLDECTNNVISGVIYADANGNCCKDCSEPGIAGVTVTLKDSDGDVVGTTTTDKNGAYVFLGLPKGSYTVIVTPPAGYVQSYDPDCTKDNKTYLTISYCGSTKSANFGYTAEKPCGRFTTFTQGGWGACVHGGNGGALLKANFNKVYPSGCLTIGGDHTLKFTSACAISSFLPQGGTPCVLRHSYTNPRCRTEAGVFAGQVLALHLNVDFSNAGVTCPGLANVKVGCGRFATWTIGDVLALAESVLGGNTGALPKGMSVSDLNNVVTYLNEKYDR